MIPGNPLIAVLIVSGHSGHQQLRIGGLDLDQEGASRGTAQGGGPPAPVSDHHVLTDGLVIEASGWLGRASILL
jgi:hypothetical protein